MFFSSLQHHIHIIDQYWCILRGYINFDVTSIVMFHSLRSWQDSTLQFSELTKIFTYTLNTWFQFESFTYFLFFLVVYDAEIIGNLKLISLSLITKHKRTRFEVFYKSYCPQFVHTLNPPSLPENRTIDGYITLPKIFWINEKLKTTSRLTLEKMFNYFVFTN